MDILSSRTRCAQQPGPQPRFYRDVVGLAIYQEFSPRDDLGVVFFVGPGLPGLSGTRSARPGTGA